jgi:hypothetical protein
MRVRNKKYLSWVRQQPSVISGQYACDPHHIIGHGQGGMGLKASDLFAFPLTRFEHIELHQHGWKTWEEKHGSQWRFVAETLHRAVEEEAIL